ncbi:DNA double-strand break repair nuclease NurA [Promineifilum sp.]|uniref:DNA double-strand break repair nuclease NurA n=1 Tax=Promineifilum sp. TaxID=2664178 RepID=UPI0035AF805E
MTLELDKLSHEMQQMARAAAELRREQRQRARQLRRLLAEHATDWAGIRAGLAKAEQIADPKYFRAAAPLSEREPLDAAISPGPPPERATLIATDGSQIMPDRHAAYLYYLVNVGAIVYHHGDGRAPDIHTSPQLFYPQVEDDQTEDEPGFDKSEVTIARDRREIETLANLCAAYRGSPGGVLALLDQRLLYWPMAGERGSVEGVVAAWTRAMRHIYETGALLAGYIDRPGKRSVGTMLQTLLDEEDVDWRALGRRPMGGELTDAGLYATLLGPGQRSPVFVDVSPTNRRFAEEDPNIEVCFFYLNAGSSNIIVEDELDPGGEARAVARVDIPRWVADDPVAVAAVHSLIYDQCRILGNYPYALTRADELAVVGRDDEASLNAMIDLAMQRAGLSGSETAKQSGKEIARGGRTPHKMGGWRG